MPLIRLNNQSISSVTALPSGVGGKVLQHNIVRAESLYNTTSTTLSEIDSNLRVTITPTSTSNKIVVRFNLAWLDTYADGCEGIIGFYRSINGGSYTNIGSSESNTINMFYIWSGSRMQESRTLTYIDTNYNSTSSIIYTPYGRAGGGCTAQYGSSDRYSSMEVMEIAS